MRGADDTFRYSICIAVALLVGASSPASLADEGADGGRGEPGLLTLDRLDAYFELEAEYARTRVGSRNRELSRGKVTQKNKQWGLEERIGLELAGTFLDPGFITYSGDFSFALTQDYFAEELDPLDRTDTDHGYLLQYDARMNFFQGKPLAGSLYGIRHDDRINRRFQPTLNRRRTGFGTSWVFAHDKFPMELTYDYVETDLTGNKDGRDDEHFTEGTLHYNVDWLIAERHKLKFAFEHAETKQEYQGQDRPYDTTRDLFTIEHVLDFGAEGRHNLRTLVHWQEESGDFARDLFEIGPQLTLTHSDKLQTMYKYQFNREHYEGLDVETQRADLQLVHRVYSNLVTTVDIFGLYEDVEDDINTVQYGASVDWQYNRKNRFGHFHANLALAYDTEETDGDNGRRVILNESHSFRDPIPVTLRNRNVAAGSVVVTDSTNTRILQAGVDYAVFRQGNVTRIARVQGGRIDDGESVLVDYQFNTPAHGQLDTMRTDFNLEHRFTNGLTPYYRWSYRNQEDDASTGYRRRADRTDHHRIGVTYEAPRYTLGVEVEIFDDTVEPYDAFHINGMLRAVDHADHTLNVSSRVSRIFFEGGADDRDVSMIDVELDHRWYLTEHLATVERLAYRFEDDSIAGDTHSWDVTAGLEYRVGDLSGELTIEYDRLGLPDSEEEDMGVYFRVRRDIPNLLAVR